MTPFLKYMLYNFFFFLLQKVYLYTMYFYLVQNEISISNSKSVWKEVNVLSQDYIHVYMYTVHVHLNQLKIQFED